MIVLVLGITFTTQAQKKNTGQKKDNLTTKQKTNLAVKKMTLKLDLTARQVKQIRPLLNEQITERKQMHEKRKALKQNDEKLTADERYAITSDKLDRQIAYKQNMKRILNEKQYEKFEKMAARKKGKRGKKSKKDKKHKRE